MKVEKDWTLNINRDYVDASVFGDVNKTYLAGLRDVHGTFHGTYDAAYFPEPLEAGQGQKLSMYAPVPFPLPVHWMYRLLGRWIRYPTFVMVEADAHLEHVSNEGEDGENLMLTVEWTGKDVVVNVPDWKQHLRFERW